MLNDFSDTWTVALLVLFPLTYLAHIAEEYWVGGGYSDYLLRTYSVELSRQRFLALQALGLSLMVLGLILGVILRFPVTMIAMLSAVIIGNALVHTVRSINRRIYSPGLITAIALWLPLGSISLITVWPNTSAARLLVALLVGVAANWIVELISFRDAQVRQKEPKSNQ
jgi:hypothetical protein